MTMFDPGDKKSSSSSSSSQASASGVGKSSVVDPHGTGVPSQQTDARAKKDMASIPKMDLGGSLTAFGATSTLAQALVDAEQHMTRDQAVAKQTLAMFQFMANHAVALATVIGKAMEEVENKDQYLQDISAEITARTTRGLWSGQEQRGEIALGMLDAAEFFQRGKVTMLQKAGQAQTQGRSLAALLESHSNNQDAKSYGRRVESIVTTDVGSLPIPGGGAMAKVGVKVAVNDPLYKYYDDAYQEVLGSALVEKQTYTVYFNQTESHEVTVATNAGGHVTFSKIE